MEQSAGGFYLIIMTPDEAVIKLESMQSQIIHGTKDFGEMAKMIREAKKLIEHLGWTSAEDTSVIRDAERWLKGG